MAAYGMALFATCKSSVPVGLDRKGYLLIDPSGDPGEHSWMPAVHLLDGRSSSVA